MKQQLLMVEDSLSLAMIYKSYLQNSLYDARIVTNLEDARTEIARKAPSVIMLDVALPDGSGMDLLSEIKSSIPDTEVIVMTAHGSSEMAIDAINQGAFDFLTKPFDAARLMVTLDNARKHQELNRKVSTLPVFDEGEYVGFIGKSLPMQLAYRTIESVAPSKASVFIIGESGTGKELAAEAIHTKSDRNAAPFHAINCAAIPTELMESELFGHTKGAFTGATQERLGAAAIANGGTLFLDEICEMNLELQKKLLRFLQTGTYQKVGSNKIEQVDIRFICATNKNPLQEVREGRFREDLYYRLHVVPLQLPSLRERGDDIELLANYFLDEFSRKEGKSFLGFNKAAINTIKQYPWPGNVRELQNVIHNIVVLNNGGEITATMVPLSLQQSSSLINQSLNTTNDRLYSEIDNAVTEPVADDLVPLWQAEKRYIEKAIALCDGSINKAAGRLEVAPSTLYRKIQSWKS